LATTSAVGVMRTGPPSNTSLTNSRDSRYLLRLSGVS
jgi:hypothetical protein